MGQLAAQLKYMDSHPWLTFELHLKNALPRLWIALGEAQSKCRHIAGVALKPEIADRLHRIYLAKGLLATTAIEGNTLTEDEVQAILSKKLQLPPSREYLAQEITNILDACNGMAQSIAEHKIEPLSADLIRRFNASVLNKLDLAADVEPGRFRKHSVGVGGYRGAPWEHCEYLVERLCEWLNGDAFKPPSRHEEVIYGLLKSVVAHIYIAWIHPFGDGNGRTARLLEVKFLLEAGVPTAAAHLLSNHYNATRSAYYVQLDRTSKSNGDLLPFIEYAITGFVDQLRDEIETIKAQQLSAAWINYVHERIGHLRTPADRRQLEVVLAMTRRQEATDDYIKQSEIRQLNPKLAVEYVTKTSKTLTRDLNRLVALGLIEVNAKGCRAVIEQMLAFLPISRDKCLPVDPILMRRKQLLQPKLGQQTLPLGPPTG
jgi:cell filamentation protein, protein adenylyltransferase